MHNINNTQKLADFPWAEWSKKDSEELVVMYLSDYYTTLDDYYLKEAMQIAKDDGINFDRIMRRVRFQQS